MKRFSRLVVVGLMVASLVGVAGGSASSPAAKATPDPRPNVILVSIDTLRADHLGCYGYPRPTSTFIDGLAKRGVRFARVNSQASWTLPSHMSLMTSLYPHSHHVEQEASSLAPGITTLAQELQRAGYATTAFVTWVYLATEFGFDRGFDEFNELLPPEHLREFADQHETRATAAVDTVAAWAGQHPPRQPFFLFVHLFDPHMDYVPPLAHARVFDPEIADTKLGKHKSLEPYIKGVEPTTATMTPEQLGHVTDLYDAEIRYTDAELGRLFARFEELGMLANTVVAITSDHGEEFGEHGSMEGHGWTLYQEVLHVPFVVRLPADAHAGTVSNLVVQSIDIAPTLLELVGVEPPAGFEGRSLVPAIRGDRMPSRPAFSALDRWRTRTAVRAGRYKFIHSQAKHASNPKDREVGGDQLFDLLDDPAEQHDLSAKLPRVVSKLRLELDRWHATRQELPAAIVPKVPELTESELERLRALGYIH